MTNVEKHAEICQQLIARHDGTWSADWDELVHAIEDDGYAEIHRRAKEQIELYKKAYKAGAGDGDAKEPLYRIADMGIITWMVRHDGEMDSSYREVCKKLTETYRRKNADYGDSFHASYEEYGWMMPAIRIEDKIRRLGSLLRAGYQQQVNDESVDDTLIDMANYAILTLMEVC